MSGRADNARRIEKELTRASGADWKDADDVPQLIFQNAAYAVRSMHETGQPTPLTTGELRAILVAMREYVPSVGAYLDGE